MDYFPPRRDPLSSSCLDRWNPKRRPLTSRGASSRKWILFLFVAGLSLTGCHSRSSAQGPSIEFTRVPLASEGGPDKLDTIEGRVNQARPGQKIVLFARGGPWWVQPLADQPFTTIQPDSTWRNSTHLGTEYAAALRLNQ